MYTFLYKNHIRSSEPQIILKFCVEFPTDPYPTPYPPIVCLEQLFHLTLSFGHANQVSK